MSDSVTVPQVGERRMFEGHAYTFCLRPDGKYGWCRSEVAYGQRVLISATGERWPLSEAP